MTMIVQRSMSGMRTLIVKYGIGYGEDCFHLFEGRNADPQPFLDRCRQMTESLAA